MCPARNGADPDAPVEWCSSKKVINGSAVTVTAVAGMILGSLVIQAVYAACPPLVEQPEAAPHG
jgi:tRNA A37 threonylcarbamoyladenosine dehydratase